MRCVRFSNCARRFERHWINVNASINTNSWSSKSKSQLAIKYDYRIQEQSSRTWVFWIHVDSTTRLEQSYRDIVDYVKIRERKNSKINILKFTHNWFRDEKNKSWLFIFDNVDNVDDTHYVFEINSADQKMQEIDANSEMFQLMSMNFSQNQNESIFITSRNKDIVLKLTKKKNVIVVKSMTQSHALTLFEKKLKTLSDSEDIADLTRTFEYMAFAIVQSAAYVCQKMSRYFVRQYLKNFRKNDRKKISFLNYKKNQLRKNWKTRNSIIIIWQISFENVRRSWSSAADLLSLMSFFDRQEIFEFFIRNRT